MSGIKDNSGTAAPRMLHGGPAATTQFKRQRIRTWLTTHPAVYDDWYMTLEEQVAARKSLLVLMGLNRQVQSLASQLDLLDHKYRGIGLIYFMMAQDARLRMLDADVRLEFWLLYYAKEPGMDLQFFKDLSEVHEIAKNAVSVISEVTNSPMGKDMAVACKTESRRLRSSLNSATIKLNSINELLQGLDFEIDIFKSEAGFQLKTRIEVPRSPEGRLVRMWIASLPDVKRSRAGVSEEMFQSSIEGMLSDWLKNGIENHDNWSLK